MLWTDPQVQVGRGPSKRGVGLGFGPDVTRRWCELNNVTAVIRSHEVRADGYAVEHDGLCITVFSCPNYCDSTGNKVHSFFFVHVSNGIPLTSVLIGCLHPNASGWNIIVPPI